MNSVQKGIWVLLRHHVARNSRNYESDDTVKGWGIQINRIDAQNKASSSHFFLFKVIRRSFPGRFLVSIGMRSSWGHQRSFFDLLVFRSLNVSESMMNFNILWNCYHPFLSCPSVIIPQMRRCIKFFLIVCPSRSGMSMRPRSCLC